MLKVVTLLWDTGANRDNVPPYEESWVCKLHDGIRRNLTLPYQFVLFTDRRRDLGGRDVLQVMLDRLPPSGASFIEPCRLDDPMILTGLDTVITGNLDDLAGYCLSAGMPALPRNPDHPAEIATTFALLPAGCGSLYHSYDGNDPAWLTRRCKLIDYLFPGQVIGLSSARHLPADTRAVFFRGARPHDFAGAEWITRHWRTDPVSELTKGEEEVEGGK